MRQIRRIVGGAVRGVAQAFASAGRWYVRVFEPAPSIAVQQIGAEWYASGPGCHVGPFPTAARARLAATLERAAAEMRART